MDERPIDAYKRQYNQLETEFNSNWRPTFNELAQYQQPDSGLHLASKTDTDNNSGAKKHQRIINSTAEDSIEILASGLMGGLTSPYRPWLRFTHPDPELLEFAPVREYLHQVRAKMLLVFAKSNFYGGLSHLYTELPCFGTGAMFIGEDFNTAIRCRPFTVGEYYLFLDSKYRPVGLYRHFDLSARQLVEMFNKPTDTLSTTVMDAAKHNKNSESRFRIIHCLKPRGDYDPTSMGIRGMQYESMYWEEKSADHEFIRQSGFRGRRFVAPRWKVKGVNTYGYSIGRKVLGDVKMLQKMEEKKLKALDKMVDPPMNAPTSMKGEGGTIIAGGVNYLDITQGQQGFTPVYQVEPDVKNMAYEIERVEDRIKRGFFNDLFLSILQTDKQMTATEVAERHEEKFLVLGPTLERLQTELLDPSVDITYDIMNSFGMLPPAPKELQGQELKVEYISILAQAQKLVSRSAIEQTVGFVSGIAETFPDAIDVINPDEAIEEYCEITGAPPQLLRSKEERAAIREARAAQMAKEEQKDDLAAGAGVAKDMAQTPTDGNNALQLLSGL